MTRVRRLDCLAMSLGTTYWIDRGRSLGWMDQTSDEFNGLLLRLYAVFVRGSLGRRWKHRQRSWTTIRVVGDCEVHPMDIKRVPRNSIYRSHMSLSRQHVLTLHHRASSAKADDFSGLPVGQMIVAAKSSHCVAESLGDGHGNLTQGVVPGRIRRLEQCDPIIPLASSQDREE